MADGTLSPTDRLTELTEKNTQELESLEQDMEASQYDGSPDAAQHGGAPEKESTAAGEPSENEEPKKQGPPGGYDSTPIPHAPPGYRIKITFHRATALPMGDLVSLSSDPYLQAQLLTNLPTRHKEDPPLRFRSRTLWKTTEPVWNEEWILDHVPASGFLLKARIYDEDASDHDDRLGNVHIAVDRIDEHWQGIKNQSYKIKKRMGSKRAYFLRAIAVCLGRASEMSGHLYVSVEVLGRSAGDEGGRTYTVGLNYWCKHNSPLLGRIVGRKTDPNDKTDDEYEEHEQDDEEHNQNGRTPAQRDPVDPSKAPKPIPFAAAVSKQKGAKKSKHVSRYNFQANQMQLTGPVPPELYHRYVEFRPFIKALFTASGLRGIILQKALHHQHAQVYNFNRDTKYGVFRDGPCTALTEKFLDLCHHAEGGRVFTYVITLDALMRFTETGKEFGIDLLSKHTMHSDADIYIAFSGEFLIRRIKQRKGRLQSDSIGPFAETSNSNEKAEHASREHDLNEDDTSSRPQPRRITSSGSPRDPSKYELIIDNDSGTYRPKGAVLPVLHSFLTRNFPGLKIVTLDGQRDEELLKRLKAEQSEHKREEGGTDIIYTQISAGSSSSSSVSSSAERDLDRRIEEDMLENRYREQERVSSSSPRDEYEPRKDRPEAKHRIGEAVLPFVSNEKARKAMKRDAKEG